MSEISTAARALFGITFLTQPNIEQVATQMPVNVAFLVQEGENQTDLQPFILCRSRERTVSLSFALYYKSAQQKKDSKPII